MNVRQGAWHIRRLSGVFPGTRIDPGGGQGGSRRTVQGTGDRSTQLERKVTGERGKKKRKEEKGEAKNNVFELGKIPSNTAGFRTTFAKTWGDREAHPWHSLCPNPAALSTSLSPRGSCLAPELQPDLLFSKHTSQRPQLSQMWRCQHCMRKLRGGRRKN